MTQANITRGGPIQYNLYILLPAVTETKSFVFYRFERVSEISYNFHFIQFLLQEFLLQDDRFRIGNDLILSYPYVKYFIDFNTEGGICTAFVVLNV